jgi:sarcosine oxidase
VTASRVDVAVVGLGAIGSATAWQLSRRGLDVVGLEQFELGHGRGASHDTSRILRRSYHTAAYVRLAGEAYDDWAAVSAASGERLVTVTGGLDLFPHGAAIAPADYVGSMRACGVPFAELDTDEVARRWPALALPPGTTALHQADTAILPAAHATATLQALAAGAGARLHDRAPVVALAERLDGTLEVTADGDGGTRTYVADRVVLAADAWTNDLLAHLGEALPLTVTREQVTYFAPAEPGRFGSDRLPVWIWMDDPSFYGFPTYDEPTHGDARTGGWVKAAQDCGGAVTTASGRSYDVDEEALRRLAGFVRPLLPGVGDPVRTVTCLYTLTPDRDFVVGALPRHPRVLVGLGAGHGFKFAPTLGRALADLATTGATTSDVSAFGADRPSLVEAGHPVSWLV